MAFAPLVAASARALQLETVCGAHRSRQKGNWQVESQSSLRMRSSSPCPLAVETALPWTDFNGGDVVVPARGGFTR